MRRFHLALSVADVADSVAKYSRRLGCVPEAPGPLRHVGWKDEAAPGFSQDRDVNGLVWEHFSPQAQRDEIARLCPHAVRR